VNSLTDTLFDKLHIDDDLRQLLDSTRDLGDEQLMSPHTDTEPSSFETPTAERIC
jgi:hypothetical protein